MKNETNWIFNLIDNITSPVTNIIKSVKNIEVVSENTSASVLGLQTQFSTFGTKLDGIIPDVNGLTESLKNSGNEAKKTETVLEKFGKFSLHFNQIKMAMESVNQAFVELTKGPVAFESSMKDLEAITGASGKTLNEIDNNARNLAKTFGGEASQSAESYKLILSKLTPELAKTPDILDGMAKNAQLLSKTMGGDVTGATELLTSGLNQFSVDMSNPQAALAEMTRQMNIMSASAKEGSAEMPQIKLAVGEVGAIAAETGVSFESMMASIQILDKYDKKGAEGGIALRNIYSKLIKDPTKEVRAGLEKAQVNISMLQDKTVPFTDKMRELQKASSDSALMISMFGDENYLAAVALMKNADAQDELQKKIVNTNTTQEQADIIMGSTAETTKRYRAVIDDLKISLAKLTGGLIPVSTILGENLVTVSQMAPALNLLKDGLSSVGSAVLRMIPKQWALNVAMLANPVGAFVAVLAALAVEITLIVVYFDEITAWFNDLPGILKIFVVAWTALTAPILGITYLIKMLINALDFEKIGDFFSKLFSKIKKTLSDIFDFVKEIFKNIVDFILEYNPFSVLITALDNVFPGLKTKLIEVWDTIKENLFAPIREALSGLFDWLFTGGGEKKAEKSTGKEKKRPDSQVFVDNLGLNFGGAAISGNEGKGMISVKPENTSLNDVFDKTKKTGNTSTSSNTTNKIGGSESGKGKSIVMNLDIKNYIQTSADNLDQFTKRIKQVVTDVIVDAGRDASVMISG